MKPPPPTALANRVVMLALGFLLFTGSLGLATVWGRQEIATAAQHNRALERELDDVNRQLDEVNAEVAAAAAVAELLRQNEAMRLGLALPKQTQVVRVTEAAEARLIAKRSREALFNSESSDRAPGAIAFRIVPASYTTR